MAGKFRDTPVVIGNLKTGKLNFTPPSPIKVPYLIGELLDWVNVLVDLNPIILAGILHYEFVRIHPFVDGNGRTARALATLMLLLNDFDIKGYFFLLMNITIGTCNHTIVLCSQLTSLRI